MLPRRALHLLPPAPPDDTVAVPSGASELAPAPPPSLEGWFRRYSAYVARIALRLLGRDDDVDDVVQDVFLRAHRGLRDLRDPEAIRGWLATVTVRVARRKLALRRLRAFFHIEGGSSYDDVASADASPEDRALLARIYTILDSLPAADRVAWTLRYVEREKLDDVARLCGCSLATAKRRINAAHAVIQKEVRDG